MQSDIKGNKGTNELGAPERRVFIFEPLSSLEQCDQIAETRLEAKVLAQSYLLLSCGLSLGDSKVPGFS
jgi:hypothetical protein